MATFESETRTFSAGTFAFGSETRTFSTEIIVFESETNTFTSGTGTWESGTNSFYTYPGDAGYGSALYGDTRYGILTDDNIPESVKYSYDITDSELSGQTTIQSSAIDYTVELNSVESQYSRFEHEPINYSASVSNDNALTPRLESTPITADYSVESSAFDVLGRGGEITLLVDGEKITAYQDLVIEKRLNEVDTFELKAFITDDGQRGLLSSGQDVLILEGYDLLFKGRFEDVTYDSSFEATCEGEGMATKLLDRKTGRDTYNNEAADDIVKDLLPTETVGEGTIEAAPTTSLRFDHDNKARALAGAANAVGYDWFIDQKGSENYENDYLNFVENRGEDLEVSSETVSGDTNYSNFQYDLQIRDGGYFSKFVLESGVSELEDIESGEYATGSLTITVEDSEGEVLAENSSDYSVEQGEIVEVPFAEEDYTRSLEAGETVTIIVDSENGITTGDAEINNSAFATDGSQTMPTHSENDSYENIFYTREPVNFVIGENAQLTEDETDDGFQANDITLLGRGDGINQLEAHVYAAAEEYTQLTSDVDEDLEEEDTFAVSDTSVLGDTEDTVIAKIGVELVEAEIIDGTTLEIIDRGVENWESEETEVITHRENISVWLYENITESLGPYTPESQDTAEEGSSVAENGVKQLRETDKTIIQTTTLEQVADRELRNRYENVKSVRIQPTQPRVADTVSLGDKVTINDDLGSSLSGEFRVVGMDINRRTAGEGTVLHCASRPRRLVERLSEIERDKDTLNAHMQGATNFNGEHFEDNVDEDNPLNNKLYVPSDVVAINKFDLTFARKSFRGYIKPDNTSGGQIKGPPVEEIEDSLGGVTLGATEGYVTVSDFTITDEHDAVEVYVVVQPVSPNDGFAGVEVRLENKDATLVSEQYTPVEEGAGEKTMQDIEGGGYTGLIQIPYEVRDENIEIQLINRGQEDIEVGFETKVIAEAKHEHEILTDDEDYGLFEPDSEPDVDIEVSVDGNVVETIENVSVGDEITEPISLKDDLAEPVTGEYHDVELKPVQLEGFDSTRSRLSADITQKVFIESTL